MKLKNSFLSKEFSLLFFLIFILVFYFNFIIGKVFTWEDGLFIFYPGMNYLLSSVSSGRFPLWVSGLRAGMPFYSDVQMGIFYPLKYFLLFFVKNGQLPFLAYQNYLVFHYILGFVLFYIFLRNYKMSKISSLIGGIIYVFSGFFSLHIIHQPFIEIAACFPLSLIILKKKFDTDNNVYYFILILTILLYFLPGSPQISLYFSYFLIIYWIYLWFNKNFSERKNKRYKSLIKSFIFELFKISAIFISVIVIGSVFFFPAFQNWYFSWREQLKFKEIADQSLPFFQLIQFFAPNFYGVVNGSREGLRFWGINKDSIEWTTWHSGYWQYWEYGFYAGQIVLISILIVLFNWKRLKEEKMLKFFFFASLVALWFMMGRYGGLFQVLYKILPGIALFRTPARMACVFDMTVAFLSAGIVNIIFNKSKTLNFWKPFISIFILYLLLFFGTFFAGKYVFEELKNEEILKYSIIQLGIAFLIMLITFGLILLFNKINKRLFRSIIQILIVIITFIDLFITYSHFHKGKMNPEKFFSDRNNIIKNITEERKRVGPIRFAQLYNGKIAEEILIPRNTAYFYPDLEVLEGYVLFGLKKYQLITEIKDEARLDLLNAVFCANYESSKNQVLIYINSDALQRIRFYNRIRSFENEREIINAINQNNLNYWNEIGIIREYYDKYPFLNKIANSNSINKLAYRVLSPEKMEIHYELNSPGIIFISQIYYDGWKTIGKKFDVIPVFGGLTGIVIPEAGNGKFIFAFLPKVFRISLLISLISFVLFISILFYYFLNNYRKFELTKKMFKKEFL